MRPTNRSMPREAGAAPALPAAPAAPSLAPARAGCVVPTRAPRASCPPDRPGAVGSGGGGTPHAPRRGSLASARGRGSRAWRASARADEASHAADGGRSRLPGDALIELVRRSRLGTGSEALRPGIGQVPQRWTASGRDAGWRGRLAETDEEAAHGRAVGERGDDPYRAASVGAGQRKGVVDAGKVQRPGESGGARSACLPADRIRSLIVGTVTTRPTRAVPGRVTTQRVLAQDRPAAAPGLEPEVAPDPSTPRPVSRHAPAPGR